MSKISDMLVKRDLKNAAKSLSAIRMYMRSYDDCPHIMIMGVLHYYKDIVVIEDGSLKINKDLASTASPIELDEKDIEKINNAMLMAKEFQSNL
jgi:hypothetical protein